MTRDEACRAEARDRAQAQRDHRHATQVRNHLLETRHERHVGRADLLDLGDRSAAAGAVQQAHERQSVFPGHLLELCVLFVVIALRRAAAHGEIVGAHDDGPRVDGATSAEAARRPERDQLAGVVVPRLAGEAAPLAEAAGVEQRLDALTHSQFAARALALDPVRTAHLLREHLPPAQFVYLGVPVVHRSSHPQAG